MYLSSCCWMHMRKGIALSEANQRHVQCGGGIMGSYQRLKCTSDDGSKVGSDSKFSRLATHT